VFTAFGSTIEAAARLLGHPGPLASAGRIEMLPIITREIANTKAVEAIRSELLIIISTLLSNSNTYDPMIFFIIKLKNKCRSLVTTRK